MINIFKVKGKSNIGALIIFLIITLGTGFLSYTFNLGMDSVYVNLKKPFFSPKAAVFPIVWNILYILMAIAAYRVWLVGDTSKSKELKTQCRNALFFFFIQLVLNFLWPILFFRLRLIGLAFIEMIVLFLFIIITTIKFYKISKISAILMTPYILWVAFALVLNYYIWILNC